MQTEMIRKKKTTELLKALHSTAHFDDYVIRNRDHLVEGDFLQELTDLFRQMNRTKAELSRTSGISEPYLHQIFSGKRIPSRDKLICLCIGMRLSEADTQKLLRLCGHAGLYARDVRDAAILFGIAHDETLSEINEHMFEIHQDPLIE
ncbi:MAG: helix-turn-helix domain-containing protein [Oscillospiraceae bacterium]|nr:helix-turn-helix domain-containing protein [Oscillospiraceae bacterium]